MASRISSNRKFIQLLNEIIYSNIQNERFGVSELAYELNMSRSNLHRRIKNATSNSVSQHLRQVRLNKALELLKDQSNTISEVAFAVGFGSVNYFSRCFRDHFGYPPSEAESYLDEDEDSQVLRGNHHELRNFPVQTTSFIGREAEIETIVRLVKEHRIVSIIGTGGCGKTRLACEIAAKLKDEYRDGIWFVPLAPVESEELVLKQLMSALSIDEVPGKEMLEVLLERLSRKNLLILLDNCEHLHSSCADISTNLIQSVPGLSLLITSREALNIKGEKVWSTSPLSLVDFDDVVDVESASQSEAVRLFADRALLSNHGFQLVVENVSDVATICQKVDGIPLAVEIVASRTKYMDVHTIIERFDGRLASIPTMFGETVERHKTLRATIEWSYGLLTEEEKNLFRKLSVFTGEFDLKAVEEVSVDEFLRKERIMDILSQLVDKSMVKTVYQPGHQMRYKLLETLREFGTNMRSERNESQKISRKHLEYYSGIAEQAYNERMSRQVFWMDQIRLGHNNIIAALNWAEMNEPERFQRLAANLSWFWGRLNNYSMAIDILENVVASKPMDKETQARLNTGYGSLLFTTAGFRKAVVVLRRGVLLWRELENKKEESLTLANLAELVHAMGDIEAAMNYAKQGYELARELNDPSIELHSLIAVITGMVFSKNTQEARPLVRNAIKLSEAQQNLFIITTIHHLMGDCGLIDGKYEEAERDYGLSLEASIKYGDTSYTCMQITSIAMAVAGQGRLEKALRLNAAATRVAVLKELWVPEEIPVAFWKELVIQHLDGSRNKLGKELSDKIEEKGRSMSLDEAAKYALNFEVD
ncbi:MAG: helix-turn-helix domain-containing protein [Bacteroidales bacterium]